MRIVLIGGLWLDASAWDAVLPDLRAAGHDPVVVSLPPTTLDDQLDAVVAAVDGGSGEALVVGHSAACSLAWLAADRRRERVARVAMVGGVPQADGQPYAPFFPVVDGGLAFPGWEAFAGPDSDDLSDEAKAVVAAAPPVPEAVALGTVHYTDPRRRTVPLVLVCPEYSPEDARAWVEGGDVPELAGHEPLAYVDIDSGHWPMFSKPTDLAAIIASLAG